MLTEKQSSTLAASLARILPSADGPGAMEADVLGYFIRLTLQPRFNAVRQRFTTGLDLLQALALEAYGNDFADCAPSQQDEILERVQSIPHPIPQRFFRMLVNITLAGFLSNPIHGGNRDSIGWQYIGFEPWSVESMKGRSTE